VLVAAAPVAVWSTHQRMRGAFTDDDLMAKPDVASAIDGWEAAAAAMVAEAVGGWRRAMREAIFWQRLRKSPPPSVLLMAHSRPSTPLADVFEALLVALAELEEEVWRAREKDYMLELQRRINVELLPEGPEPVTSRSVRLVPSHDAQHSSA
jgi:hypothetical protein